MQITTSLSEQSEMIQKAHFVVFPKESGEKKSFHCHKLLVGL